VQELERLRKARELHCSDEVAEKLERVPTRHSFAKPNRAIQSVACIPRICIERNIWTSTLIRR